LDRGLGPDLASVRAQDGGQRLAERAHAAPDVAETPQVLVDPGGQVVGLRVGGSRCGWPDERSDGAAKGEKSLDGLRLEVPIDQVPRRAQNEASEEPLAIRPRERSREIAPCPVVGGAQEVLAKDGPDARAIRLEAAPR